MKSASVKASPALPPIRVFSTPVVTAAPALSPTATLYIFAKVEEFCADKARLPIATDLQPLVSVPKASKPKPILLLPSVKASPAIPPIRLFLMPVVTDSPAL